MKHLLPVLMGVMVLFAVQPAKAISGQKFLQECKPIIEVDGDVNRVKLEDTSSVMSCGGFVKGIQQTANWYEGIKTIWGQPKSLCLPQGIPLFQLIAVAYNHVKKMPENWHYEPAKFIIVSWMRAWPCK